MAKVTLFTIGFTKTNAETFFSKIKDAGIKKLIDVRLNNVSQLSGFAKRDDLKYFLRELCKCDYLHMPMFAPTKDILDSYKKKQIDWIDYEIQFNELMKHRSIEKKISLNELDHTCLLCSEPIADKCHRRLVAEYFKTHFGKVEIKHF